MKGVIVHSSRIRVINTLINQILFYYLLSPLKSGLYGFAVFFTILISVKAVVSLFDYSNYFIVNTEDVLLSSFGFGVLFLIRLVQNLKNLNRK